MLVHQVHEFLKQTQTYQATLRPFDSDFLAALRLMVDARGETETLTEDDVMRLQTILERRWQLVCDTSLDYTFKSDDINHLWIELARALAPHTSRPYLSLLIPCAKNTHDPITFEKLSECPDPRLVHLGDDDETLYQTLSLFPLNSRRRFATFEDLSTKDNTRRDQRPLSLKELLRIKRKTGEGISLVHDGKSYRNPWHLFQQVVLPTFCQTDFLPQAHAGATPPERSGLKPISGSYDDLTLSHSTPSKLLMPPAPSTQGELPTHLLSIVLDLAAHLAKPDYNAHDARQVRLSLNALSDAVVTLRVDDANCFYGQVVVMDPHPLFLVEILLDCHYTDIPDRIERAQALVKWCWQIKPSLVSSELHLTPCYAKHHIGPYVPATEIASLLQATFETDDVLGAEDVRGILERLQRHPPASLVDDIKLAFAKRWERIKDTPRDYLRLQSGNNALWIRCAEVLMGAGWISCAYGLLIPSLIHQEDPITRETISIYPLSHFILSADEKSLILLDNSVHRYRECRTFYNCHDVPARPFTLDEQARIRFAARRFQRYLEELQQRREDFPIYLSTVMAVKKLVEDSLFPEGLYYGVDYSPDKMELALAAYGRFSVFFHALPEDERVRLNQQRILFHGRELYFEEVITKVQEGGCIATYGQYLAQLVVDYLPYVNWKSELEARAHISEMRLNTKQKALRDYEYMPEVEAMRRLQKLAISLLTHSFHYLPLTGQSIQLAHFTHTTHGIGAELMSFIKPVIEGGRLSQVRFALGRVYHYVETALSDDSWMTIVSRYEDTNRWMRSILDHSLFTGQLLQSPQVMFIQLAGLCRQIPSIRSALYDILDNALQRMLRGQSPYLIEVIMHCEVRKWLPSQPQATVTRIKEKLAEEVQTDVNLAFRGAFVDYLMLRVIDLLCQSSRRGLQFFSPSPAEPSLGQTLKRRLSLALKRDEKLEHYLLAAIEVVAAATIQGEAKASIYQYLDGLRKQAVGADRPPIEVPSAGSIEFGGAAVAMPRA